MFYVGMTACAKVWLQPLYMVDCCHHHLVLCRHSVHGCPARLIGDNVLQVLATLILLSFTKIYCTVVLAMKFTTLYYPVSIQKLLLIGLYGWMDVAYFSIYTQLCCFYFLLFLKTVPVQNRQSCKVHGRHQ